jgi:protein SCO1/2
VTCLRVLATMVVVMLCLLGAAVGASAHELTPDQLRAVTFHQQPGAQVPLDLRFRDEDGQPVRLGDYFGQRPVILTMNYFHCRNLCPLQLEGLLNGLNGVSFSLGTDYSIVSLSIDPREGPDLAESTKLRALRGYDRRQDGGGWHVLTGDQAAIDDLTRSVGFEYLYDPDADEYAHPLGIVLLTPDGRVSRYLYGLDFSATDLRLGLVDAAADQLGSVLDRALLVCYHYDPLTGRYTPLALNAMRFGGATGVVGLGVLLTWLWRTEPGRKATRQSRADNG